MLFYFTTGGIGSEAEKSGVETAKMEDELSDTRFFHSGDSSENRPETIGRTRSSVQ
jgi:hypothetical protein